MTRRSLMAGLAGLVTGEAQTPSEWPFPIPDGVPWPRSRDLGRLGFTGRHRAYTNADTWYPSWASDGHLYSPWTDGYILDPERYTPFEDAHPGYACNSLDFMGRRAATAQARIEGDDPLRLKIVNLPPRIEASPAPYGGRYPCGSLVHNGIWYYGTYCLANGAQCGGVGWTKLGPLVGLRVSKDYGVTWEETAHTPAQPIFGENPDVAPVRFGTPHFVDFGKNLEHSPDGRAYLAAHGTWRKDACNSWIQGDGVYLLRVKPSLETVNDAASYECFAGMRNGKPRWSQDLNAAQPVIQWPDRLGCVTATYNPGLRRYLMCVTRGVKAGHHDTILLESERIEGPWRTIDYLTKFGPEAYFVNIPSKFIQRGGRTFWLCYSANWSNKRMEGNPKGSEYALTLMEATITAAR